MKTRGKQLFSLLLALTVALSMLPGAALAALGGIPIENYVGTIKVGDSFAPGIKISAYLYGDDSRLNSPKAYFLRQVGETAEPVREAVKSDYYDRYIEVHPVCIAATDETETGYFAISGNTDKYLYKGDDPDADDGIATYFIMLDKRPQASDYYDYYTPVGLCTYDSANRRYVRSDISVDLSTYKSVAIPNKMAGSNYNYLITLPDQTGQYSDVTEWVVTDVKNGNISFTARTPSYDPLDHMPWDYYGETGWYDGHTQDTEYVITTAEELAGLAKLCNTAYESGDTPFAGKTVKLGADIDLTGRDWTPFIFAGEWGGPAAVFDGQGHAITNLNVTHSPNGPAGLFGRISEARLQNFTVSGRVVANSLAGGVAGYAEGATLVNVGGLVEVTAASEYSATAGGLVGESNSANILNCYARGAVSAIVDGEYSNEAIAGGIVGKDSYGAVINCYHAGGAVSATGGVVNSWGNGGNFIGGIVGDLYDTTISHCHSSTTGEGDFKEDGAAISDAGALLTALNDSETQAAIATNYAVAPAAWALGAGSESWPEFDPAHSHDTPHSHDISVDCGNEDPRTFTALGDAVTFASGSYYLEADKALTKTLAIQADAEVNLCLNGKELKYAGTGKASVIKVSAGATLNICDCSPLGGPHPITSPVTGETVAIQGGLITGGTGNFDRYEPFGGGIYSQGAVTLYGGAIAGNTAKSGGGVYTENNSSPVSFTLRGGSIRDNKATMSGGGAYIAPAPSSSGLDSVFSMSGGSIQGNQAEVGGGVSTGGTRVDFSMSGGSIHGNLAENSGGVNAYCHKVSLTGGAITGNAASKQTGGIDMATSSLDTLTLGGNMIITQNTLNGKPSNIAPSLSPITVQEDFTGRVGAYSYGGNTHLFQPAEEGGSLASMMDRIIPDNKGYFVELFDGEDAGKLTLTPVAITAQPTAESPTVEVNYAPQDIAYQWYTVQRGAEAVTDQNAQALRSFSETSRYDSATGQWTAVEAEMPPTFGYGYFNIPLKKDDIVTVTLAGDAPNSGNLILMYDYFHNEQIAFHPETAQYALTAPADGTYTLGATELYGAAPVITATVTHMMPVDAVPNQTSPTFSAPQSGNYACKITWPDGMVLLSDPVSYTPPHTHSYTYAASGAVVTESCDCGHSETATLAFTGNSADALVYNGAAQTPSASVAYSDGWVGGQSATVYYEDNTNAGTNTAAAKADIEGQTASLPFSIQPLPVALVWTGESFTQDGTAKKVTATVQNKVGNDQVSVSAYTNNEKTAAGSYTAQATELSNSNYTLTGGTNLTHDWTIRPAAPAVTDAAIDYAKETIAFADGYEMSSTEDFAAGTGISTGSSITSHIAPYSAEENVLYIRARAANGAPASAATAVPIPARPKSPDAPAVEAGATALKVTGVSGLAYTINDWTASNTNGQFTELESGTVYTVKARMAATTASFHSEAVSQNVRTLTAISSPTGTDTAKGSVTADKSQAAVGDEVTYTVTFQDGYTPELTLTGNGNSLSQPQKERNTWTYTYRVHEDDQTVGAAVTFAERQTVSITYTGEAVTLFADSEHNVSEAALRAFLNDNVKVTPTYDNGVTGPAVGATYELTSDSAWNAKGGTYTYIATVDGKTCEVPVTVMTVNAAIGTVDDITKIRRNGGYTAHGDLDLPDTASVTYSGEGYTTRTANLAFSWSEIPEHFGKAIGSNEFTGAVDLPSWATYSTNTVKVNVSILEKPSLEDGQMTLMMDGWTYGEEAKDPKGSVTIDSQTDHGSIAYQYSADSGETWTDALPRSGADEVKAGVYQVKMHYEGDGFIGSKTAEFTVKPKAVTLDAGTLAATKTYDGETDAPLTGSPGITGLLEGDTVTATGGSGVFAAKDVGTDLAITVTGVTLEGEDAGNYSVTGEITGLTGTITPADGKKYAEYAAALEELQKVHIVTNETPTLEGVTLPTGWAFTGDTTAKIIASDDNDGKQSFPVQYTPSDRNYAPVTLTGDDALFSVSAVALEVNGGLDMRTIESIGGTLTLSPVRLNVTGAPLPDTGPYSVDKMRWSSSVERIATVSGAVTDGEMSATVTAKASGVSMVGVAYQNGSGMLGYVLVQVMDSQTASANTTKEIQEITDTLGKLIDPASPTATDKAAVDAVADEITKLPATAKQDLTLEDVRALDTLKKAVGENIADAEKKLTIRIQSDAEGQVPAPENVEVVGAAIACGVDSGDVVVTVKPVQPRGSGAKLELELNLEVNGSEQTLAAPMFFQMDVPEGIDLDTLTLYHVKDDGSKTKLDFTNPSGRTIAFKMMSFSSVRFVVPTGGASSNGGGAAAYTLTASAGKGGGIDPSGKVRVTRGSDKTFTITPDKGYEIADVLADGKSVGPVSSYTFENITKNHTIAVSFRAQGERPAWNPFTDVTDKDWFYDSVKYVYERGLMNGTGGTAFSPELSTTRGMIVTVLWRLEQKPKSGAAMTFTDVKTGSYCQEAVRWGAEHAIVKGYNPTTFGPDNTITRQELAAILYRYSRYKGYDLSTSDDLTAYLDRPDPWAENAMKWAVGTGIVSGKGSGVLDPRGHATRAQAAAMLTRFVSFAGN